MARTPGELAGALESVVDLTVAAFETDWTPAAEAALHHAFAQIVQARSPGRLAAVAGAAVASRPCKTQAPRRARRMLGCAPIARLLAKIGCARSRKRGEAARAGRQQHGL